MTAQNKTQNDGLFLLEVLIDKITFEKTLCLTDKDFRTCVTVECLNVAPLEICDDEPGAGASEYKSGGPFVKNFNNGKSCLFSLQEGEISKAMGSFTIKITVSKSLPCGCLPNKIVMGEAAIDMTKEFVETRNNFLKDPNNVSYQALKDSFKIRGPDNIEVGDVIMFLRISCFGKLIITKFQGSGGPPQLTGGSNYVDRSCNPPRESQTRSDPCACGVGRSAAAGSSFGGGGAGGAGSCMRGQDGLCPVAQSYYNSAPCEEPDDPCFCSGPRQEKRQQLACRNTDPYCLHLPKGPLLRLPLLQDNLEDSRGEGNSAKQYLKQIDDHNMIPNFLNDLQVQLYQTFLSNINIMFPMICKIQPRLLYSPSYTVRSKRLSVSFSNIVSYVDEIQSDTSFNVDKNQTNRIIFGEKETTVFMTLLTLPNDRCRNSETQATATINKCLQVKSNNCNVSQDNMRTFRSESSFLCNSSNTERVDSRCSYKKSYNLYPMSSQRFVKPKVRTDPCSRSCSQECKGKKTFSTNPCKALAKAPPPKGAPGASGAPGTPGFQEGHDGQGSAGELTCCRKGNLDESNRENRTVTHITIAPRGLCPIYQSDPCQGPKCISLSQPEDPSNPVQMKEINNPRRGVFELVVRKNTGVPELMMEWRPPFQLSTSSYANKCKMIVCVPSTCRLRCSKISCSRPCPPKPCFPRACGQPCLVYSCGNPCKPKPCGISPCSLRPCIPGPCRLKPVCRKCCKLSCTGGCKPRACAPRPKCRPCRPRSPCPLSRYRIGTPSTRYVPCQPTYCSSPCPPSPCCISPPCRPQCPPSPCSVLPPCRPKCPPSPCRVSTPCSPQCPPSPCSVSTPCRPQCPPSPCSVSPPCRPQCSPCPPQPCYNPCILPCVAAPCSNPCQTSPCLRLCPVGRKLRCRRKSRNSPKIRAHRQLISPCYNRSSNCPVVRCRRIPEPFKQCCTPSKSCCATTPC